MTVLAIRKERVWSLIAWMIGVLIVYHIVLIPAMNIQTISSIISWVALKKSSDIVILTSVCIMNFIFTGILIGCMAIAKTQARIFTLAMAVMAAWVGILVGTMGHAYREANSAITEVFYFSEPEFWAKVIPSVAEEIIATIVLSAVTIGYIARRVIQEDLQFATPKRIVLWLLTWGGTCFKAADMSGADFSAAWLAGVSFTGAANLDRVNWRNAQGLQAAGLTGTILEQPAVRDLLLTGRAEAGHFQRLRLEGAYLRDAALAKANFTGADLRRADLGRADLSGANLAQVNLRGANLSGVTLTGACLADWLADETTLLAEAKADYVFTGLDKAGQYVERQPPTGNFREGEFIALFGSVANTFDFIVKNRIELVSLLHTSAQLCEETPGLGLEVQSIEKIGAIMVVSFSVLAGVGREQFYTKFKEQYETRCELDKVEIGNALGDNDKAISNLQEILQIEARSPIH